MAFTQLQLVVLCSAVLFFSVLYFGCPTKSPNQKSAETSRKLSGDGGCRKYGANMERKIAIGTT